MKKLLTASTLTAKVAIVVAATLGGTALVSSSVFASLTATAFNTSAQSVSTATLKLTQAASGVAGLTAGFTSPVTSMAPGDTVNRFIDLSNGGTMAGQSLTLKVADSGTTVLTTDPTNGLQVTVKECSVVYTTTTGACSGTETPVVTTSANTLLTAQTATVSTLAVSSTVHLKFIINLPAGSETTINGGLPTGTVQGVTTCLLTWTFAEAQRTATNTVA